MRCLHSPRLRVCVRVLLCYGMSRRNGDWQWFGRSEYGVCVLGMRQFKGFRKGKIVPS